MKSTVSVPQGGMKTAPAQDLRSQLAEYVAQQPASKQSFHKWMQILEWASLALPVGVFAVALYLSITWRTVVPTSAIPTAWFCFPLSFTPFLLLVGIHTIGLQAWPPTGLFGSTIRIYSPLLNPPSRMQPLQTGKPAVAWGWGTIVVAMIAAAFWGAFIWAVWTTNMALIAVFIQVLGTLLAVIIVAKIVLSIVQKIAQPR